MRIAYAIVFAASMAAAPAMAQVVIQTPNPASAYHQQQANQDRTDAHIAHREAQDRAAVGDYRGAAEAQAEAHHDWHAARHQEGQARTDSGAVVIGR